MEIVPIVLALCGLFLIAGLAASILDKTGQHGPQMANTLSMVVWVAGIGIVVGVLSQIVFKVDSVFHVF